MQRRFTWGAALAAAIPFLTATLALSPQAERPTELPGWRADGSVLLPNGWSLEPVGDQIPLGDFPVNIAVHPTGRYAAILNAGYGPHEVLVVDLRIHKVVARAPLDEAFYGLEFARDGKHLYGSGASAETVQVFHFAEGQLVPDRKIPLRNPKERGIPGGLAATRDGRTLFVANVWGQSVSNLSLISDQVLQQVVLGAA